MDHATDLATALDLESLDRDLFRAVNTVHSQDRIALFGGQVAAQALMAAGRTVPEGRLPHSLHGYFLRPGRVDLPVILRVDRDRDGRSLSARHVAAIQDGEVIFSMLASFETGRSGSVFEQFPPMSSSSPDDALAESPTEDTLVEVRQVTRNEVVDGHQYYSDSFWIRAAHPLPADPLVHACALAYMSDLGVGFGRVFLEGCNSGGPSIDHALWFHEAVAADDWVLVELFPWKATAWRGLYHGVMRDAAGRVGATLAQEHLVRSSSEPPPDPERG